MNKNQEFPAELVEARAKELSRAWEDSPPIGGRMEWWRDTARLSLRREVEACEPLVKALRYYADWARRDIAALALEAHAARYAPAPETLADVAREAAEALRGNAALSARLLAAVERAVKP